jgi:hypothetical protein
MNILCIGWPNATQLGKYCGFRFVGWTSDHENFNCNYSPAKERVWTASVFFSGLVIFSLLISEFVHMLHKSVETWLTAVSPACNVLIRGAEWKNVALSNLHFIIGRCWVLTRGIIKSRETDFLYCLSSVWRQWYPLWGGSCIVPSSQFQWKGFYL